MCSGRKIVLGIANGHTFHRKTIHKWRQHMIRLSLTMDRDNDIQIIILGGRKDEQM